MKKDGFYFLRVYPLVFMLIVTLICISIVTGLHLSTKSRVDANENLFLRTTVLQAADVAVPEDFREVNTLFESIVSEEDSFYKVSRADGSISFVVPTEGAGLWGLIKLMVGFDEELEELTGIGIFAQNETPGLGARIEEEWYRTQFSGKQGPFVLVDEGAGDSPDEIDAITGATRTSRAMLSILNDVFVSGPAVVRGE